jgi:hypothetical protein
MSTLISVISRISAGYIAVTQPDKGLYSGKGKEHGAWGGGAVFEVNTWHILNLVQ